MNFGVSWGKLPGMETDRAAVVHWYSNAPMSGAGPTGTLFPA